MRYNRGSAYESPASPCASYLPIEMVVGLVNHGENAGEGWVSPRLSPRGHLVMHASRIMTASRLRLRDRRHAGSIRRRWIARRPLQGSGREGVLGQGSRQPDSTAKNLSRRRSSQMARWVALAPVTKLSNAEECSLQKNNKHSSAGPGTYRLPISSYSTNGHYTRC